MIRLKTLNIATYGILVGLLFALIFGSVWATERTRESAGFSSDCSDEAKNHKLACQGLLEVNGKIIECPTNSSSPECSPDQKSERIGKTCKGYYILRQECERLPKGTNGHSSTGTQDAVNLADSTGTEDIQSKDSQTKESRTNQEVLSAFSEQAKSFDPSLISVTGKSEGVLFGNTSDNIFNRIFRLLLIPLGTAAILFYIIGAYFLVSAGMKEGNIETGKDIIIYTTMGLLVAFSAYIIVQFIRGFFF